MVNPFTKYSHRVCNLCNSTKFRVLIDHRGNVLKTNNEIVKSRLKKIECLKCGLVRDGLTITEKKLKNHYTQDYENHHKINEKSIFYTSRGFEERSHFVASWISEIIKKSIHKKIHSILEVGCGTGELMLQLKKNFPGKKIIGIESSKTAVKIGRKRGLEIVSIDEYSKLPKVDLVISFAVLEHTPNPTNFLKFLGSLINPNGFILIGQPHQDKLNYDIFFQDHLYHFSTKHIEEIARKLNLKQIKKSLGTEPLPNFSMHLLKFKMKNLKTRQIPRKCTKVSQSIKYYQKVFKHVNKLLTNFVPTNRLAIFGTGQFFHLFYAYTNLSKTKIRLGIDDFPSGKKFPFKVITSSQLDQEKVDGILLCVNPFYTNFIQKKLGKSYQYLLPFNLKQTK